MQAEKVQPRRSIVVTGATGFLGSRLTARAVERGWRVRAIARAIPPDSKSGIDWRTADIADPNLDWDELVDGADTVFHLAWSTVPFGANNDPAANIEDNLPPGLRLAAAVARRAGTRLIFFSSGGTVYGPPSGGLVHEDQEKAPASFYGESKLSMERHLDLFHRLKGLDRTALRISNPYGYGQRQGRNFGAVSTFAERALAGQEIVIWGDGSIVRDYLYIDDAIDAAMAAVVCVNPRSAYNVGSGVGTTLNEIVYGLSEILQRPLKVRYEPPRAYDVPINVLDIRRAMQDLNWKPNTNFQDGLSKTVREMIAARG